MNSQSQANKPTGQSCILIGSLDLGGFLGGGIPSVLLDRARKNLQKKT